MATGHVDPMGGQHDQIRPVRRGEPNDLFGGLAEDDFVLDAGRVGTRRPPHQVGHLRPRPLFHPLIEACKLVDAASGDGLDNMEQREMGAARARHLDRQRERRLGAVSQVGGDEDVREHRALDG